MAQSINPFFQERAAHLLANLRSIDPNASRLAPSMIKELQRLTINFEQISTSTDASQISPLKEEKEHTFQLLASQTEAKLKSLKETMETKYKEQAPLASEIENQVLRNLINPNDQLPTLALTVAALIGNRLHEIEKPATEFVFLMSQNHHKQRAKEAFDALEKNIRLIYNLKALGQEILDQQKNIRDWDDTNRVLTKQIKAQTPHLTERLARIGIPPF